MRLVLLSLVLKRERGCSWLEAIGKSIPIASHTCCMLSIQAGTTNVLQAANFGPLV